MCLRHLEVDLLEVIIWRLDPFYFLIFNERNPRVPVRFVWEFLQVFLLPDLFPLFTRRVLQ